VGIRVVLAGFFGMMSGMDRMAVGNMGVVAGGVVVAGFVVIGGALVMGGCVFVVLSGLAMMFRGFLRHGM
jgi:hypothetical protein